VNATSNALNPKGEAMCHLSRSLRSQDSRVSRANRFLPLLETIFPVNSVTCMARTKQTQRGVSLVELSIVVAAIVILTAAAIPAVTSLLRGFTIGRDTRAIAGQLNLGRMRAASDYTHARVYVNLTANTYHLEIWNKTSACWQTEGDSNACTQTTSPVNSLSNGDTFGFGSITTGPTAATSSIAQAPACTSGVAGPSPGTTTANTACIEFNSRGYPLNSSNTIVASDAIYVTNNSKFFSAIAVPISGQPSEYRYSGSTWFQF
jgi:prepilin-type N-terminal cleavage/methylation domain-containing protein